MPKIGSILMCVVGAALLAAPTTARETRVAASIDELAPIFDLQRKAAADGRAFELLENLTTEVGPRLAGSDAEARARTWAVERLRAWGFANVRVDPFSFDAWERGEENASIVGPYRQQLKVAALGGSAPTPAGGVTLPVVYFPSLDDLRRAPDGSLKGKIAFVSNAMQPSQDGSTYQTEGEARFNGPVIASNKGAEAIVIRSIGTDRSRLPHTGSVVFGSKASPIPSGALSTTDASLLERIVARGKPVLMHLELGGRPVGPRPSGNVIAEVPGTDPNAGIVLIGAHLDSWDLGTGALDDGAGVAITAAAAKLVMEAGPHRRTVRIVWFGAEEYRGLGGRDYASRHAGEQHAIAAESDFGDGSVWRLRTSLPPSLSIFGDRLLRALRPLGIIPAGGTDLDGPDIDPLWRTGVLAIELGQSGMRYFDFHHTADDTLDRIDPEQLRQNVAAWATMVALAADAPEPLLQPVVRPTK